MAIDFTGGISTTPEHNVLQSFSDATAGRSIQLYWAVAALANAGTDYTLMRDEGLSTPGYTKETGDKITEIDFDITINKTTIVAGISCVDCKIKHAGQGWGRLEVELFKYDGSETSISDSPKSSTVTADTQSFKLMMSVTRTTLKVGDVLRFKAYIEGSNAAAEVTLYHDPQVAGNELKLWVPVVCLD